MTNTEAPEITTSDIRALLDSPAEEPVLYIKLDEDDGTPGDLDVWARALVPHNTVVLTRSDVEDALGGDQSSEGISEFLPAWQEEADRTFEELAV